MPRDKSSFAMESATRISAAQSLLGLDQMLLNLVDYGLASVLLVAPWFMGGRHPLGQLVLVALSVAVAVAWVTRQALAKGATVWKVSASEILLMCGIALVVFQLTPIPAALVSILSPQLSAILPLWSPESAAPDHLGAWSQLTLTPDATRAGLIMLLCYGMLFVVTLQRLETIDDVERLLRWFALSAILLACVGLLQYLTSNGRFLWIYDHPFRDTHDAVKGPFINKNHFAHLLALGLGPLIWSVQRAMSRVQAAREPSFSQSGLTSADLEWLVMVHTIGLGLVLFAGLMTFSRGGILAMFVALAASVALLYRTGKLSSRLIISGGGVLLMIGSALAIHGYSKVTERLDDYVAGSVEELDQQGFRRKLWQADLAAARDYATFGTGIGSHRDVYRMYLPESWNVEMTHAENGYLQVALEAGLPGLALLLVGIGMVGYWSMESLRSLKHGRVYVAAAAVVSGLLASVVHSWVDFVWYISSCMAATTLLMACCCRLMELSRDGRECWVWLNWQISRTSLAIATALLVLVGGWMVHNRFRAAMASPHWDAYMAYVCDPANQGEKNAPSESLLDHMRMAAQWTPEDAHAHVVLAKLALQRFDEEQQAGINPMALAQVREAAMASRFPSRQSLDNWLAKAVGEHRRYLDEALWHTRQALTYGPLLGEGYLYLAELCFLENAQPETKSAYVDQSLAVRPFNGDVLLVAGKEAALAGQWETAIEYWRRSAQISTHDQKKLIDLLAQGRVPASFVIENFEPRWPAVTTLLNAYQPISTTKERRLLVDYYLQETKRAIDNLPAQDVVKVWRELASFYNQPETADNDQMIKCLAEAIRLVPSDYNLRRSYVNALVTAERWDEAAEQAQWCLQRKPNDQPLRAVLAQIARYRPTDAIRSASRDAVNQR